MIKKRTKYTALQSAILLRVFEDDETGCWNWTGCIRSHGYGVVSCASHFKHYKQVRAHRASYEAFVGKIPYGLFVLHKCDNTRCVNPSHLFLGTQAQNMQDKKNKKRTSRATAKLTSVEAHLIRHDLRPQKKIAAEYSITQQTVSDIQTFRRWATQ